MSLTYAQYVQQIATLAVVAPDDPNYVIILPEMIEYAELRMQRDIDFLQTVGTDTSYNLTANNRVLTFTQGTFVTLQNINVITPSGATVANGLRRPLLPVDRSFLDMVYGAGTGGGGALGVPCYFHFQTNNQIIVGPWPDMNYNVEMVGTQRFPALSVTNTTTFISTYLPDVFIMASMIFISGFQRNFGAMSSDPQMAMSYEQQYGKLLQGAQVEEARKRFQSGAWGPQSPTQAATPSR